MSDKSKTSPGADEPLPATAADQLATEELLESSRWLRAVVNSAPLVLIAVDAAGNTIVAEGQGLATLGVEPQAMLGRSFRELFARYPETRSDLERALAGEDFMTLREVAGTMFETRFLPQRGPGGAPSGMIAVAYDVTARVHAERSLRESEETARALLNAPTDGAVLVDREGTILAMNATAERRFREHAAAQHVMAADFIGTCVFDLFAPELREQRKARNDEVFLNGERRHFEDERAGVWTDVTLDPIVDSEGCVSRIAIFSRDITDRKRDEAALRKRSRELEMLNDYLEKTTVELERSQEEVRETSEQLAELLDAEQVRSKTDTLTGALNHGAILDVAAEAIAAEVGLAVAMVDVDGMKSVNDTYGHQAGDDLLLAVTNAINRGGAIVGRYGGDEFVVALLDASREEAEAYKEAVEKALAEAQVFDAESGAQVPVVASVGIAIYPEDAATLTALIESADERMYEQKKKRGGSGTGLSSSRTLGDERTARMVGELVPLLTSSDTLDEKLRLVAHRLSVGAGYAAVSFDIFSDDGSIGSQQAEATHRNAFAKAPAEALEAWNEQRRAGANDTGVGELLRETRKPLIIDDISESPYVTEDQRRLLLSVGIVSGIVVPLFSDDAMIATMSVGSKEPAGFGQKDVLFLTAVAGQVAAIIRMARLVEHLQSATDRLEASRDETVMLLASATEAHSQANNRHFQNVRDVAMLIATEMGFSAEGLRELGLAAALHDVGKIHLPDALLSSPERISPLSGTEPGTQDWEALKAHCVYGRDFLDQTRGFELAAQVAYTHHERWDGAGYPEGLAGEAILLESAIIAVADSLDAMMTERAYQASRALDAAMSEIEGCSGTQFSPVVVTALLRLHERGELPDLWAQDEAAIAA